MSIKFTKHCQGMFNPLLGCKTIQLGTLNYYKEFDERSRISDKNEGVSIIHVKKYNSKEDKSNTSPFSPIFQGNIILENCVFETHVANSYLFSLTMNQQIEKNIFCNEYNSFYIIKDLKGFKEELTRLLLEIITINDFENQSVKDISEADFKKKIKLNCFDGIVQYSSRKKYFLYDTIQLMSNPIPQSLEVLFTKEVKYVLDNEYRIVFCFSYNNQFLKVKKSPMLIPSEYLLKYFEALQ